MVEMSEQRFIPPCVGTMGTGRAPTLEVHWSSCMGLKGASKKQHYERSSKGGRIAHETGAARQWTVEEAREAGRQGGIAAAAARRKRPILPPGSRSG